MKSSLLTSTAELSDRVTVMCVVDTLSLLTVSLYQRHLDCFIVTVLP